MTDTTSPPQTKKPDETSHKAWVATFGAAVLPLVIQNLAGANDALGTIFDYVVCDWLQTACPTGDQMLAALKAVGSSIAGGIVTGYLTYKVANRPKDKP